MNKVKYSFYIDQDILNLLKVISESSGVSVSWLINNILEKYCIGIIQDGD